MSEALAIGHQGTLLLEKTRMTSYATKQYPFQVIPPPPPGKYLLAKELPGPCLLAHLLSIPCLEPAFSCPCTPGSDLQGCHPAVFVQKGASPAVWIEWGAYAGA